MFLQGTFEIQLIFFNQSYNDSVQDKTRLHHVQNRIGSVAFIYSITQSGPFSFNASSSLAISFYLNISLDLLMVSLSLRYHVFCVQSSPAFYVHVRALLQKMPEKVSPPVPLTPPW